MQQNKKAESEIKNLKKFIKKKENQNKVLMQLLKDIKQNENKK